MFFPGLQVDRHKAGPLHQVCVRTVESKERFAFRCTEKHTVATVFQKKRISLNKMPVDLTVIGNCQALGISFF